MPHQPAVTHPCRRRPTLNILVEESFTMSRVSRRTLFTVCLLLLFVICSLLLSYSHATNAQESIRDAGDIQSEDPISEFMIAAPYWSNEKGFVSTIEMKNYRVDELLIVTPVLYPLHGHEIKLDPIALNPSETRLLNINEVLKARREKRTVGAVEISYSHTTEGVFGANLTVLNEAQSLVYNFQLQMPEQTNRLEGLWWFPDQETDGFVAVQNASADPVTATPTLYIDQRPYQLKALRLQPHEMRLIELRHELRKLGLKNSRQGGIQLASSRAQAVIAGGGLAHPQIGFSAPVYLNNQERLVAQVKWLGQTLHALNVAIGAPAPDMEMPVGSILNPVMNLRNISNEEIRVQPVFKYQIDDTTGSVALPEIKLRSQENERVELLPFWQSGQIPHNVSWGTVEINYTGNPGSLIAMVTSVDQSGTFVFDAKIDNRLASGFHGEFWSVEGDNNTFVTIKNITPARRRVVSVCSMTGDRRYMRCRRLPFRRGKRV